MKMIKILQTASLFSIIIFAVSCRSSRPVYEGRYPPREYPSYPPPPPPPVYYPGPQNLPPGQAKKVYGGRSARPYAPGQRKKYDYSYRRYPLIIIRTPEIIIGRYNDGRYYYQNPEGYMYWKGYDDRFYLDEKYLNDNGYDENEYNDWKYKGRKNNNDHKYQKRGNQWKD
ncbi:MAG TPA: hypothetical protein VFU29_15965 [Chitinophagaceae bacterium]|nr:hypothetical protein [Chitinophagaceae bacterium]